MIRSIFGLLVMGLALTTATVPLRGETDLCAGGIGITVSPTSFHFGSGGGPSPTHLTITANPFCGWSLFPVDLNGPFIVYFDPAGAPAAWAGGGRNR